MIISDKNIKKKKEREKMNKNSPPGSRRRNHHLGFLIHVTCVFMNFLYITSLLA